MENEVKFKLSEIFFSIQGEGSRAGLPCVFVRLQGCRLRCSWCDTKYALDFNTDFYELSSDELINEIKKYNCNFVEFTGGEPLEQKQIIELMSKLCDENYTVAIETSGYIDASELDSRIIKIIDVKCPDSLMSKKNNYQNLININKDDEVKFVIASKIDYEFAMEIVSKYDLTKKCNTILFSPVFGEIENRQLAEWIIEDNLNVRFQLQIHKYIWDPKQRGV